MPCSWLACTRSPTTSRTSSANGSLTATTASMRLQSSRWIHGRNASTPWTRSTIRVCDGASRVASTAVLSAQSMTSTSGSQPRTTRSSSG